MKHEIRTPQIEIRAKEEEPGKKIIFGYAAKYNSPTFIRDIWGEQFLEEITPGAFSDSLENNIRALYNHQSGLILGTTKANTLKLFDDEIGLRFELELPNTSTGKDLYESVKRGDIEGNSFGFTVKEDRWTKIENEGEEILKRSLLKVNLIEISPTPFPAYSDTEISCRDKISQDKNALKIKKLKIELDTF